MPPARSFLATSTLALLALIHPGQAHEPPKVVASIQPVHSLVAGVMDGVGEPVLIVRGYGSPHTYQMRPSEAAALQDADAVFWIGRGLETFLARPISNLGAGARAVALMDEPGMTLLAYREGGPWEAHTHDNGHDHDDDHGHDHDHDHAHDDDHAHDHDHDHDHDHAHDHDHDDHDHAHDHDHHDGLHDAHVWLDTGNARVMIDAIARTLAEIDPDHADRYEENARALTAGLDALDAELSERLAPVADAPFIVFHDAFQYLERQFGLNAVGSITVAPERLPGAARLREIRGRIAESDARCVFREPQFESALIATVVEGTAAEIGVLDPLGADFAPGPDGYFDMMRSNAGALVDCLSARS